jgi:predicted nucleic acid-binding protein
MLVHVDTSVLVDAFTGARRSLASLRAATASGEIMTFSTLVLYEWLRGPRTDGEKQAVEAFFGTATPMAIFGQAEAARAAALSGRVKRARQRQADLAIAACALEAGARLWTLNRSDFADIPDLALFPLRVPASGHPPLTSVPGTRV